MCPPRAPNKKFSTILTDVLINSHIRVPFRGHHNTPHNDIQQNDTQNNDTPHNNSHHNNKYATISTIPLNIMTLDIVMLSVANKLIFIFLLCWVSLCWTSLWWVWWRALVCSFHYGSTLRVPPHTSIHTHCLKHSSSALLHHFFVLFLKYFSAQNWVFFHPFIPPTLTAGFDPPFLMIRGIVLY